MSNNVNKDLIRALRKRTNISLIKCKQALIESKGNIELAIDNLRRSGLKTDFNKFHRSTAAGIINAKIKMNNQIGFMIEINCETDFVSKNSIFQEFAKTVLVTAVGESIDDIDILRAKFEKQRLILINQVKENIQINRFVRLTGNYLSTYVHGSKIGVIVSVSGNVDQMIVKHIAMHIAAKNPKYIYLNDIPNSVIDRERHIQTDIAMQSLKSTNFLSKIVEGRIKKYIDEILLIRQEFIFNTNKNVGNVLDEYGMKIDNFVRFEIGKYD